jgi:hypothetical protein
VRFPRAAGPDWLSLVKDSPFNAVVVNDTTADKPLIDAARTQGLAVAVLEGQSFEPNLLIRDAVWPRVASNAGGSDAGPTGSPWIDSNGWRVQLARARAPSAGVWVLAEPPEDAGVLRVEHYIVALADAAIYGARWPVTVRNDLRNDTGAWKQICEAVRFFETRRTTTFQTAARLGVCSTFSGPIEDLATEVLNLASRRLLPYRVLLRDRLTPAALSGLQALVWIDEKAPEGDAAKTLDAFVRAGGLLILPASAAPITDRLKPTPRQPDGYAAYANGSGRIAVARQPWVDPFVLAAEAHMLLSRKHDVIRMWNAGVLMARYSEDGAGRGRAELINFAGRASAAPASVWVARKYRVARFTALGAATPLVIEAVSRGEGTEVHVPPFAVFGAVELEN